MSGQSAIEIDGVSKRFKSKVALDQVFLKVPEGSVYGLLGPNGAGKTTLIRILNGLIRSDAGGAIVCGERAGSLAARRLCGYLPDDPGLYPWMTGEETLLFVGRTFGLSGDSLRERCSGLLRLAGLEGVNGRTGTYSRGMKQRLGIATALMGAPRLLMLDEPTSALDPMGRRDVLEMVSGLRGRTTVLFSTHILADAERVCDDVAILDRGVVRANGPLAEVMGSRLSEHVRITVHGTSDALARVLVGMGSVSSVVAESPDVLMVKVAEREPFERDVPRALTETGSSLAGFEWTERSLEDSFMDLIKEGAE